MRLPPPIPGAPWTALLRDLYAGSAGRGSNRAPTPEPPPEPVPAGAGKRRPFINRVPNPKDPQFGRLLGYHTEILASHFNDMVRKGVYVNDGPDKWTLNLSALTIASQADADAKNGTIYFSTDSGKLSYKDASGVVHDLH